MISAVNMFTTWSFKGEEYSLGRENKRTELWPLRHQHWQCGVWFGVVFCLYLPPLPLIVLLWDFGDAIFFLALGTSLHSVPHLIHVCLCMHACLHVCISWSLHSQVENPKQAYPWPQHSDCLLISPVTKSNWQGSDALRLPSQMDSESWADFLSGRKRSRVWRSLGLQSCFQW